MRYDILKIAFSHAFSMEEAKVAPFGESRRKCMGKLQTLECHIS